MKLKKAVQIKFQVFGQCYLLYTEDSIKNISELKQQIQSIWSTAHLYAVELVSIKEKEFLKHSVNHGAPKKIPMVWEENKV